MRRRRSDPLRLAEAVLLSKHEKRIEKEKMACAVSVPRPYSAEVLSGSNRLRASDEAVHETPHIPLGDSRFREFHVLGFEAAISSLT